MINISLTQFLNYSAKVSTSARINEVKKIKNAPGYSPAIDYWKKLRDKIKYIHENNLPIENLRDLLTTVPPKDFENYSRVISAYIKFINKNEVEYFSVGKAFWEYSDEFFVGSNPELGLIINGKKFYIKNYYKKPEPNTKLTKRNIKSTLTLMQLAKPNFEVDPNAGFAVLNLQNGKLIEGTSPTSSDLLELELDAQQFINMWNRL